MKNLNKSAVSDIECFISSKRFWKYILCLWIGNFGHRQKPWMRSSRMVNCYVLQFGLRLAVLYLTCHLANSNPYFHLRFNLIQDVEYDVEWYLIRLSKPYSKYTSWSVLWKVPASSRGKKALRNQIGGCDWSQKLFPARLRRKTSTVVDALNVQNIQLEHAGCDHSHDFRRKYA